MNSTRKTAIVAGVFFLITEVTAIGAMLLYDPALKHADYVLGAGADNQIFLGALLEVILIVANVGTAVALYPVIRKQNEAAALGYVAGRILEGAVIAVGIVSVLSVVTLRQQSAGASDDALEPVARSLVALHDWTFLLGPGFMLGLNSLVLAYLMYRSGLVPRVIAVLGLVGGPLIVASGVAVLYGVYEQADTVGFLVALPVFAWEVSLAVWLIVKGFKPAPIIAEPYESRDTDLAVSGMTC